jgi:integrase
LFPTKTDGKAFLQSLRRGANIQAVRSNREVTLSEWFAWLADNDWPDSLAEVTITQRKRRFAKYVEKHFGQTPLSKIDPLRVRAFYKELREQGASPTLVISVKGDLVRAFNQAVTPYQRIPTSLANPFRLPLPQPQARDAVALAPDEVRNALRRKELDLSRRAMLALFLLAGVRLGEMMAATVGQLRFDDDLIVIDRAVRVAFGGLQTVGFPKKGKTRNAVMCRFLKDILRPFVEDRSPDEYLWPAASENKPRMKKLVYATWRTIVKDAKLPSAMSPHDCRLTHINIIEKLMPTVSPTTFKEHVGHAASGVTEANYTRPLTTAQTVLRDELDRVFG